MADRALITQVTDWLVEQALGEPDIVDLFDGICNRLLGIGVPIDRANLMWSTLHPLFQAEGAIWLRDAATELGQFPHQDITPRQWDRSPMRFMLDHDVGVLRRQIIPGKPDDEFEITAELAAEGYTDYLAMATDLFAKATHGTTLYRRGMFVTWASKRPGGFSDDDLSALQRIQRSLAIASKTVIQARMSRNIAEAYLGRETGRRVLAGSIRLGDGEQTRALLWYSDLRSSTRLAETMPSVDFLNLLNVYFECAARPAIAAGGEVLAFVGDAVLAIFPLGEESELLPLVQRVTAAIDESFAASDRINAERIAAGLEPFRYGIGLNVGEVTYGNIGVPERLAFSAIGPTVIEVARIEKMTKSIGARALATRQVASTIPSLWQSVGMHRLEGVGQPEELFGLREESARAAA